MISVIDSNILIYAHNKKSKFCRIAQDLFFSLKKQGKTGVCDISLIEFFQVTTNHRKFEDVYTEFQAAKIINSLKNNRNIRILGYNEDILNDALNSVEKYSINGYGIYDHLIASTCYFYEIKNFYTANTKDFLKYKFLDVKNPFLNK